MKPTYKIFDIEYCFFKKSALQFNQDLADIAKNLGSLSEEQIILIKLS